MRTGAIPQHAVKYHPRHCSNKLIMNSRLIDSVAYRSVDWRIPLKILALVQPMVSLAVNHTGAAAGCPFHRELALVRGHCAGHGLTYRHREAGAKQSQNPVDQGASPGMFLYS